MSLFSDIGKNTTDWAIKNAPTILTCVGAAGVIFTAVASGKAAIKAKKVLDDMPEDAEPIDKIKAIAPVVAKPAILACGTMWVIFSANKIVLRRNAALVAAYAISSRRLEEYEDKVVETIGAGKNKKIKDKIAEDYVANNPPNQALIDSLQGTEVICIDKWSGQEFKAQIEDIRKVQNDLNEILMSEGFVELNEFYDRLGINTVKEGQDVGWNRMYEGQIEFDYSSQLSSENVPMLVIDFKVDPKQYYDSSY